MPNRIFIGPISSTNPCLWLDATTISNDPIVYQIATNVPAGNPQNWFMVNQFCSILAIRRLQARRHGTPPSPYGINNFSDEGKIAMAERLICFASMQDQVKYAIQELGGTEQSLQQVGGAIAAGQYPVGTMIWAGSNAHVTAIYITGSAEYEHYDPDTGLASPEESSLFIEMMTLLGKDAFVVATPSH